MSLLYINDLFFTFQGEGRNAGRRALFVRMPKCNLSCSWCDTEFDTFQKMPFDNFNKFAASEKCRFAVITGGEPLQNKHTRIVIEMLKKLGYEIACETNGTMPFIEGIDFVTCSPKRDAAYLVHDELWSNVSEFKYVVDSGFDWSILDRHNQPIIHRGCYDEHLDPLLTLSPEFGRMKESCAEIFEYIKEKPWWKLSLQTHKWLGIK